MALELRQQLKLSQQLVMTPQLQQAIKLYDTGQHSVKEIEELTGIKKATLYRGLKDRA